MPITSVTYLPPNQSMLYLQDKLENEKTANQQIVDRGWFAASSIDYLISTVKIEKSGRFCTVWVKNRCCEDWSHYLRPLLAIHYLAWITYDYESFVVCLLHFFWMEKLLGTLAFKKVPRVERSRKRECSQQKQSSTEKKPKLLEEILNGKNPPSLFPSYTMNGIFLCLG